MYYEGVSHLLDKNLIHCCEGDANSLNPKLSLPFRKLREELWEEGSGLPFVGQGNGNLRSITRLLSSETRIRNVFLDSG
jgi:hypothetical protein